MQGSLISAEIASFVCTFVKRVFVLAIPDTYKLDIPCNKKKKNYGTLYLVYGRT